MKKIILLIVIVILAIAAFFVFGNKGSKEELDTAGTNQTNTADTMNDEMGDMASTTPPATPPTPNGSPPPPIQDDLGDVDVVPPKVFNITGRNFAFSQTEIKVKKGDRVVINFESTDGFHDWTVDEFNARTERVNPGTKTSVEFIADKIGTFEYYCSVSVHRAAGMKGNLIVE